MNTKVKGYLLGMTAAATYGMNPLFALPLYADGMLPASVLFYRYLMAIVLVAAMLKIRGHDFSVSKRELGLLAIMGMLMAVSSLTLFESYRYMDAGIASTLLFVSPLMVALIMAAVFHERLTRITWLCLLLALVGIGLLYKGEGGETLSLVGTLMVFASSLSYAIYIVSVNKTVLANMPTLKVTFYVLTFGLTLFIAYVAYNGELQTPSRWYLWGNLFALALFPTTISFLCTTGAIRYIGSTPTAILGALEPVTAIFFGILVFNEQITVRDWTGILLILLSVSFVVAGKQITAYLVRLRKMFPRRIG